MGKVLISIISLLLLLTSFQVGCANAERPITFTDEDLNDYRKAGDEESQVSIESEIEPPSRVPLNPAYPYMQNREDIQRTREQQQQEYWCSRGQRQERAVEDARRRVELAEEDLRDSEGYYVQSKQRWRVRDSLYRLDSAKASLQRAEDNMSRLEEEARRKSVPPGWLRCQF